MEPATFVIKRETYPETFLGFNEYSLTSWTSRETDGLRVAGQEIEAIMKRIQATNYTAVEKLSAHLLPYQKVSQQKSPTFEQGKSKSESGSESVRKRSGEKA